MFQKPYFYFLHGEITSTASQLTSPASQKSKDLNKVLLLLQDLDHNNVKLGRKLKCVNASTDMQGLVIGAELCLNPYFFGWLEK